MKAERMESWEEAFSACRERNKPLVVSVPAPNHCIETVPGVKLPARELAKIFPSGRLEEKGYEAE